jgi:hypothetical protein
MFSKKVAGLFAVLAMAAASFAFAAKLPRPMADSTIDLPNGKKIRLIDTRGKVRVVVLVDAVCDHCANAVKWLSKVERDYRAKGVQFYGAAIDVGNLNQLTPFVVRSQASFPFGSIGQYPTKQLADFKDGEKPFVPMILFVDKSNHVLYQFFGQDSFFKEPTEQEARARSLLNAMLSQK